MVNYNADTFFATIVLLNSFKKVIRILCHDICFKIWIPIVSFSNIATLSPSTYYNVRIASLPFDRARFQLTLRKMVVDLKYEPALRLQCQYFFLLCSRNFASDDFMNARSGAKFSP
jgi:hypothetical protein